ncbi:hypothetical protein [Sporomusa sp.]|uniref:hypothetical protein n=1 Tax=Sporomusa sp. TaxID=2078658 RepID=UPI002BA479A4|nr:hypothetical protein [Sporomusa sp.]HWR07804.1 hypothetical protein [Sporomusa sp.]
MLFKDVDGPGGQDGCLAQVHDLLAGQAHGLFITEQPLGIGGCDGRLDRGVRCRADGNCRAALRYGQGLQSRTGTGWFQALQSGCRALPCQQRRCLAYGLTGHVPGGTRIGDGYAEGGALLDIAGKELPVGGRGFVGKAPLGLADFDRQAGGDGPGYKCSGGVMAEAEGDVGQLVRGADGDLQAGPVGLLPGLFVGDPADVGGC